MDNEERKKKIETAIRKHMKNNKPYRGAYAHKLVLSMSAEFNEKIRNSGLNPDKILIRHVKKVMRDFQNNFHKGDRIGYAYGLHHDTDNLHVHIYLLNRTEKGIHVAYSKPLKGKYDPKPRKNQMGFCNKRLEEITENFIKNLDAGEKQKLSEQAIQAVKIDRQKLLNEQHMLALSLKDKYKTLIRMEHDIVNHHIPPSYRIAKRLGLSHQLSRALGSGRRASFKARKEMKDKYFALKKEYFYDLYLYKKKEKSLSNPKKYSRNRSQEQQRTQQKRRNKIQI
jgi:hypothetical protein